MQNYSSRIDKIKKEFPAIQQVVHFLKYLKIQTRECVYSVNTGKKYQ